MRNKIANYVLKDQVNNIYVANAFRNGYKFTSNLNFAKVYDNKAKALWDIRYRYNNNQNLKVVQIKIIEM